jgi:hypothetical protein
MFRFTIRDVLPLVGAVLAGALFCGSLNAAVSDDPVEAVYQWMRGIALGGFAGAAIYWIVKAVRPGQSTDNRR